MKLIKVNVKKPILLFGFILNKTDLTIREKYRMNCYLEQYSTMCSLGAAIVLLSLFNFAFFNILSLNSLWMFLFPFILWYLWFGIEKFIRKIFKFNDDRPAMQQEADYLQYEYLKECKLRETAYSFSFLKYYKNSDKL